jgi:hypothetical protein
MSASELRHFSYKTKLIKSTIMRKTVLIIIFSTLLLKLHAQTQEYTEDKCIGGTAYASSTYGSPYLASAAFDDNITVPWVSGGGTSSTSFWIAYNFTAPKIITKIDIRPRNGFTAASLINFSIEASNNSTNGQDGTWTTITSGLSITAAEQWSEFILTNTSAYTWYRLTGNGGLLSGTYYANIGEIQMRESVAPGSSLPQEFSSDKCSGGTPFASSVYDATLTAGNAFDDLITSSWVSAAGTETTTFWLGYHFNAPVKIEKLRIHPRQGFASSSLMNFSIEVSTNSTNGTNDT